MQEGGEPRGPFWWRVAVTKAMTFHFWDGRDHIHVHRWQYKPGRPGLGRGVVLDWPDLGHGPDHHAVSFVWPAFQIQLSSPPDYFVNSLSSF